MQTTTVRIQRWSIHLLALIITQFSLVEISAATEAPGQYFKAGCVRCFAPAGKSEPQSLVTLQLDFGTRENCESRLARIPKTNEVAEALGGLELWCSSESSTMQLKFHGVFRNRLTGKSMVFESNSIELCSAAVEAFTGGQAVNNKLEVIAACQAR